MPMHHHHHENKRDKRNERLMRMDQHGKGTQVMDRPIPLIDIGEQRISEIIHEIIGTNEDAFQDAWVEILSDHCKTEEDVERIAVAAKGKNYVHKYTDLSLQKPLAVSSDKSFTLEDAIASPELVYDEPEPQKFKQQKYKKSYLQRNGMDEDVALFLRQKYPGESLKHALRMALGLPVKDTKHWKAAEIEVLKSKYPDTGAEAVALELGRTVNSVWNKVTELKVKRTSHRHTPKGAYNCGDVCRIFHFSGNHLRHILSIGMLPWRRYKKARIFHRDDIVSFIRNHPFKYRHDLLEIGWRSYVPATSWEWVTINDMALSVYYGPTVIRRLLRTNYLSVKKCGKVTYVRVNDIKRALDLRDDPQPYRVMRAANLLHYVQEEEKGYWVRVCAGKGAKYSWIPELIKLLGHPPIFVKGCPTCLKCLKLRESWLKHTLK